jgi:hypothetical protein
VNKPSNLYLIIKVKRFLPQKFGEFTFHQNYKIATALYKIKNGSIAKNCVSPYQPPGEFQTVHVPSAATASYSS